MSLPPDTFLRVAAAAVGVVFLRAAFIGFRGQGLGLQTKGRWLFVQGRTARFVAALIMLFAVLFLWVAWVGFS